MQVEVNETNIDLYGLVELSGNSREFLLNQAADASANGVVLSCNVPDDLVVEQNVFDVYESEHVDPKRLQTCGYEKAFDEDGVAYYVCVLHGKVSRHDTYANKGAPCMAVDPHPNDVIQGLKQIVDTPKLESKIGSICSYDKKDTSHDGTVYVCRIHGRPSKHDISRLPNQPCLSVDPYTPFEDDPTKP